ncbi:MAG TPA: hypothetical protein VK978_00295, partial [Candidatus Saccharimonadales bacterium]|nr:hypothetical protein [Candidatus Saccharimonadales bacterium]
MDGFFRRPAGQGAGRPALEGLRPRPQASAPVGQAPRRRIDDFRRSEGFHAPVRRSLQPSERASQPRQAATPQVSATLAKQLNLELPGDTKKRGKKSRAKKPLTRMQKVRRWTLRVAGASMLLALVGGGLLFG